MANALDSAPARSVLVMTVCLLANCYHPDRIENQCLSQYPRPTAAQVASDTASIPATQGLPLYRPSDSSPQIRDADSTTRWYRNLFYAHFEAFPGGGSAVRSFLVRFQARIVGRGDEAGWYAVLIPDPGPDTAKFTLLRHCIGATFGAFVRDAHTSQLPFLESDTAAHVLPN